MFASAGVPVCLKEVSLSVYYAHCTTVLLSVILSVSPDASLAVLGVSLLLLVLMSRHISFCFGMSVSLSWIDFICASLFLYLWWLCVIWLLPKPTNHSAIVCDADLCPVGEMCGQQFRYLTNSLKNGTMYDVRLLISWVSLIGVTQSVAMASGCYRKFSLSWHWEATGALGRRMS